MSEQEFDGIVEIGRRNQQAKSLLANHCAHARLELPNGTSMAGSMLGLDIGMAWVRCQHAPMPRSMSMHGLELAVAFYEENCHGCPHRSPNGLLPTIATEADDRRRRAERAAAQAAARLAEDVAAWERRRGARRTSVAAEGYPARDLAADLDLLDPHPGGLDDGDGRLARRRLVESARRAPALFSPAVSRMVLDLAVRVADPTACTVLRLLARSGQVTRRAAAAAGAHALAAFASPEAGRLVAELAGELSDDEAAAALPGAIQLAGDDDGFLGIRRPPEPASLLALAARDLVAVTAGVAVALDDVSDQRRADAAEAARYLLMSDPGLVIGLGPALVASIRGADEGYAGTPSPGACAARALAEAWRGEPQTTVAIVEAGAAGLTEQGRGVLASVVRFLRRWDDDTPVPPPAVQEATAFLLRRLDGGWGGRVADEATDELLAFATEYPADVLASGDALLAALLSACQQPQETTLHLPGGHGPAEGFLQALEQMNERVGRHRRRTDLAQAVGRLARQDPEGIAPKVSALLGASTGDQDLDGTTRAALVDVLAESVTAATVAGVLPTLYTSLLSGDVAVRAAAVGLWQSCARAAKTLPEDLTDLTQTLLLDPYVAVHSAMLRSFGSLGLPDATAASLVDAFAVLANVYDGRNPDLLDRALHGVLWAAARAEDEDTRRTAQIWTVSMSPKLGWHDRERLLLDDRLRWLRPSPVWAVPALGLLAEPGRVDRFNSRDDELLAALLNEPRGMAKVSEALFLAAAKLHLPDHHVRAAEPVELLQVAGRWSDAAALADHLVNLVPQTREHGNSRWYLTCVAAAAHAEQDALHDRPGRALPKPPPGDEPWTPKFVAEAVARREMRAALAVLPPADPTLAAASCDAAAAAAGTGEPAARFAEAVAIGAHLLRHDAAVRSADPDADRHHAAAVRSAQALAARLSPQDPLARVASLVATDSDAALAALRAVPVRLPLCDGAFRSARSRAARGRTEPEPASEPAGAAPTAVCVLSVDDQPVVDVIVVRSGWAYDLTVDVRLTDWPEWANTCHVSLLTTLPPDVLSVPRLSFSRSQVEQDEHGLVLAGTATLLCTVERGPGRPPLDLPVHVRFSGSDGSTEQAEVGGYRRLRLRPYDPSRDALTQHTQIDQRLLELYDPLHDDATLNPDDVAAFCRLFTACVSAAQKIMFDGAFRSGRKVSEQEFHDKLEARLLEDPLLEGRLSRRDKVAGGFDDLLHDDVIAELKVEKTTPRRVEDCARYIGQPTQYGVGRGSRLSILVVLDHTRKAAPPAVLENHIGWLLPAHHGLDDPRYPSRVGVLVINTNWPVPSAWSRRRTALAAPPAADVAPPRGEG
jgi:hypothetical protein